MALVMQRGRRDGADQLGEWRVTRADFQNLRGGERSRGFLECRTAAVGAQWLSDSSRPFIVGSAATFAARQNSAQGTRRFQEPSARRPSCHGYSLLVRCYCNGALRNAARLLS